MIIMDDFINAFLSRLKLLPKTLLIVIPALLIGMYVARIVSFRSEIY